MSWTHDALSEAARMLDWLSEHERDSQLLVSLSVRLAASLKDGHKILTCGNGGSMCDAMHFSEELTGRFRRDRMALPAMAISDPSHLTCVANDWDFDRVFARAVEAWGRAEDWLIVFSTSGRSRNIVAAAKAARDRGMFVAGLLGRDGGTVLSLCDAALVVPATTSDRIQEIHGKVVHLLIEGIERQLVPENYAGEMPTATPL